MEFMKDFFPLILCVLLIILVIVLIILGIRLIKTLGKVDQVVEDVNTKVKKLDGLFSIVDTTADAVSMLSDKVVTFIANGITKMFSKKRKKKEEDEENE